MTASEAKLPPACPEHRDLVRAALDPNAPDEVLERYATEVTGCEACRRALAIRVGAIVPPSRDLAGMASLHAALAASAPPSARLGAARRGWRAAAAAAVLAALGAAAGYGWTVGWPGSPADTALTAAPEAGSPSARAPVAPSLPSPAPTPVSRPSPSTSPSPSPSPSPSRSTPLSPSPSPSPSPLSPGPAVSVAPSPVDDDAVADVGDWPAPPYDDLRVGGPKSAGGPALRAVQLVVSRAGDSRPPYQVGERVQFTVVASREAELALCVSGPERGVVWRGAVPAGRSDLTHAGKAQAFAFSAPGTYRFTVGDAPDDPTCGAPLHVVDLDVD